MEIKGALTLPRAKFFEEELFDEQVDISRMRGKEIEATTKMEKCCSCGEPFEAKSWHEPPSCPFCHVSRVD